MTTRDIPTCSACSLLCSSIDHSERSALISCPLRNRYLHLPRRDLPHSTRSVDDLSRDIAQLLSTRERPLIWLDGADVQTTRSAVRLSQVSGAAIAVLQSAGQRAVQQVMASDGWLGTTLADMRQHSRLVVTLGDLIFENSPLLAERFLSDSPAGSERCWYHVSDKGPDIWPHRVRPDLHLVWPRSSWYANVVSLNLGLRRKGSSWLQSTVENQLLEAIGRSTNTTIMFDTEEMSDPESPMLVQQLLTLCRYRSRDARCNLLAWDSDAGSATAQAVLLWLTGCCQFARPMQSGWSSHDHFARYQPSDWQDEFDGILIIRSAPSMRRLPELSSDITLCENPQSVIPELHHGFHPIAAAGMDCGAFFCRGDHAMISFAPAIGNLQPDNGGPLATLQQPVPTATELLTLATQLLRSSRARP